MKRIEIKTSLLEKIGDFFMSHTTLTYACQIDDAKPFVEKQVYDNFTGRLLYSGFC